MSSYDIHMFSSKRFTITLKLIKKEFYLDLTPNSHNLFTRNCVAAIGEN